MIHRIGQRDEGYLLAYDTDPEDLVTHGILMTDLARWIEAIDARAVIVCLDCCHAAKIIARGGPLDEAVTRDMRIRPALLQSLAARGRYLIASCDEGQVSVEAEEWGHGLFTYHLLEGLSGAGDRDRDGKVGIAELFEYVAESVERDAHSVGKEQRPWSSSIGPGGVFLSILPSTSLAVEKRIDAVAGPNPSPERGRGDPPIASLIARIEAHRRSRDPAAIPEIFRALTHESKEVRERAKVAAGAVGWERTSAAIMDLARQGLASQVRPILEGLGAFESHRDVVALLDRLILVLKGDLRNQAILMLDRKRLVLEMEKAATVFRAIHSPLRLIRVLGQGLFASAYAAIDEDDELDVVVRVLRPEFARQPLIRANFLDLGRQSRRIVHQNLVLTREVRAFPEHELYFLVRDHVNGVTLQSCLFAATEFSVRKQIAILKQIGGALGALHHAGIVHCGVKPSNIFLTDNDRVVLGDPSLPMTGIGASMERLAYDYQYAVPEMFQGSGLPGREADLYALGCVAHELACGLPPFVADNPFQLSAMHVQSPLEAPSHRGSRLRLPGDALLLKLLAKSPSDRYTTSRDLLRDLELFEARTLGRTR